MMIDPSDPYYTATGCTAEGFPVRPVRTFPNHHRAAQASSDPILTHERWSGEFRGCAVELPTGTVSGVAALRINKSHEADGANGVATFQRLKQHYGWTTNTAFFEDSRQRTYLYECHEEIIIDGGALIARGLTLYGNGASIILPPYPCYQSERCIGWAGNHLTRESLLPIPLSMVEYAVHALNVSESYDYYLRVAA